RTGPRANGAAISRPERNCELTSPRTLTLPPGSPAARTVTGGLPSTALASTPRRDRASTRSPTGRSRMRALPSRTYSPSPAARMAVRKRSDVPERRRSSVAARAGSGPPAPWTTTVAPFVSSSTPSRCSARSITSESSATSAPLIFVVPRARAASGRARLVRLFEPGTVTLPLRRACGAMRSLVGSLAITRRGYTRPHGRRRTAVAARRDRGPTPCRKRASQKARRRRARAPLAPDAAGPGEALTCPGEPDSRLPRVPDAGHRPVRPGPEAPEAATAPRLREEAAADAARDGPARAGARVPDAALPARRRRLRRARVALLRRPRGGAHHAGLRVGGARRPRRRDRRGGPRRSR